MDANQQVNEFQRFFGTLRETLGQLMIGQREVIEQTLISLVAGGHVLLEGVPGLGKTRLVKSLAQILNLDFSRMQFTPDLMPADIIGTTVASAIEGRGGDRTFTFQKGPIFGNIVLADEINRATPKTQSALLEAMEERAVTVYGTRYPLPPPFFLMATQNPIEMEGTYALPEAQVDRFFFKILIHQPTAAEMRSIIDLTTGAMSEQARTKFSKEQLLEVQKILPRVAVSNQVKEYAIRLYQATHPESEEGAPIAKKYIEYGMSPRGAQSLVLAGKAVAMLQGRFHLATSDLRAIALPAMRHRVILNFDAEADGVKPDDVVRQILEHVPDLPAR
jgi:MoxR-like ATPase